MRIRVVQLVNLTGHDLLFEVGDSEKYLDDASLSKRARVRGNMNMVERLIVDSGGMSIPVLQVTEQEIVNLPDSQDGVIYIVSGIVAASANRDDVLAPGRVRKGRGEEPDRAGALVRPRRIV